MEQEKLAISWQLEIETECQTGHHPLSPEFLPHSLGYIAFKHRSTIKIPKHEDVLNKCGCLTKSDPGPQAHECRQF
jgi:hypothetical protein